MSGLQNPSFVIDDDGGTSQQEDGRQSKSPGLHRRNLSGKSDTVDIAVDDRAGPGKDKAPHQRKGDPFSRNLDKFWKANKRFVDKHAKVVRNVLLVAFNAGIVVYLFFASQFWVQEGNCVWAWCTGFGLLIIMLSITYFCFLYFLILKPYCGKAVYESCFLPVDRFWDRLWESSVVFRGVVYILPLAALAIFLGIDTHDEPERLISFGGMVILMLLGFLFSKYPGQIIWRPVFWGLALQFIFGLVTIRWKTGREVFACIGDKVALFLSYSYNGSSFVYGDLLVYQENVFAFQVLPVIFFFSFIISILFYWGAIQTVVMKLGWLLQISMGTTVCESVNAAASIFLGQTESPLLIKPFIKDLTRSEIHAVMTGGFATVAGTVLAAYISFGVSPAHLVTASVMSAPASLCYAKLFYPETEVSKTTVDNIVIEKGTESSVLDAATKGALAGVDLVMGIISNIIAFVAAVAFVDALLLWTFELVGQEGWDFQFFLGYIFLPLAYIMGVEAEDCKEVAQLIGLKTIVNEFVAYQALGELTSVCAISLRSEAIATYALCGFANPSSIGILVGGLSIMAPNQRVNITSVAFRAFIAGSVTSFLTACIAGILLPSDSYDDFITTPRNCTYTRL